MIEQTATVRNSQGIHCRPSAVIVKAVQAFDGEIVVASDEGSCDPRSIMALLSLGLQMGTALRIRVSGPDEERHCRKLVELFETEFDFPPREPNETTEHLLHESGASGRPA